MSIGYKKGDLVRCADELDMIETDAKLCNMGYDTDYVYNYKGVKGFWIEIFDAPEPYDVLDQEEKNE